MLAVFRKQFCKTDKVMNYKNGREKNSLNGKTMEKKVNEEMRLFEN